MKVNDTLIKFINDLDNYSDKTLADEVKERLNKHLDSYLKDLYTSYVQLVMTPGKRKLAKELARDGNKSKKRSFRDNQR
jgi:hypothetical protein